MKTVDPSSPPREAPTIEARHPPLSGGSGNALFVGRSFLLPEAKRGEVPKESRVTVTVPAIREDQPLIPAVSSAEGRASQSVPVPTEALRRVWRSRLSLRVPRVGWKVGYRGRGEEIHELTVSF